MGTRDRLAEHLPVFGLEVRTPRLTLRYPDDEDAVAIADVGAGRVHAPEWSPFIVQWTAVEPPFQQRNTLSHLWQQRTTLQSDAWSLPLAVVVDGEVVGVQAVAGQAWSGTRTVATGSWIGHDHQGRGIGKEMRRAALHLAFAGFDAARALTGAYEDNPASLGVTRALGYRENGSRWVHREGDEVRELRFVMGRADWAQHHAGADPDEIELVGAEATAAVFGTEQTPRISPTTG